MALASRWRLIQLQRDRDAVRGGIELLDRKREALVRELVMRRSHAGERRHRLGDDLHAARRLLRRALEELGRPSCQAAALAQRSPMSLEVGEDRVLGVGLPRVDAAVTPFEIVYGPGGTSAAVDRAAQAFAAILPPIAELASQEAGLRNLTSALQRTMRTLNALETVLLPELEAEIRAVLGGLEEEERDERSRWRRLPKS